MDVPGISTRPIVLANGDPETAEVFFDDVRIPADQILGQRGEGWGIAMTTLAYERGPGDVGVIPKYEAMLRQVEDAARERGLIDDPVVRSGLARAYTKGEAMRLAVIEQLSMRVSGQAPGSEGSIAKLLWTDAEQSLQHLALDVLGPDAWLGRADDWLSQYLWSRAGSVYGGSAQIQKNLVAQRLPRDPGRSEAGQCPDAKHRERRLTDVVQVEVTDGVMTVTLNRPDRLNALDHALLKALTNTWGTWRALRGARGRHHRCRTGLLLRFRHAAREAAAR